MSIETIYDGIKQYIENELEKWLDPEDDISTPMFDKIMRSSVYDIMGLQIFPCLMMEYDEIAISRETVSADRYLLPITFYCISKGGDAEQLQIKSERYVWALKQLFENDLSLNGLVDRLDIVNIDFSPSLKRQNVFIHTGAITVNFDVLLNRS